MAILWHHLITRVVLEACETVVEHGWEIDSMLALYGGHDNRLHVAEVVARAASMHDHVLPPVDRDLAFRLRFHKDRLSTTRGGALVVTHDGRLGYNIGDGRVIESSGNTLTIINNPEHSRYAHSYRFPDITSY